MYLPLVSVICICYNHEAFVEQAINSVVNQTYKNIELIVINNASTDNSDTVIRQLIKKNPSITYHSLKKRVNATTAFNDGFKLSNGSYLIDLAADDILLDDCIEKQVCFIEKQTTDVGLIFGNAYHIDAHGNRTKPFFSVDKFNKVQNTALHKTNYLQLLGGGLVMCSVSSMFTRKHFEILNGYNESLFFEDLDYWLRLSRNYKIEFLDDFLVEKRYLPNSLGNQFHKKNEFSKRINQSLRQIFKESIDRNHTKAEHKALLKRIHFSMEQCFLNKLWLDLVKFSLIEMQCRIKLL